MKIQENIPLALLTTIKLGGRAKYFVRCTSVSELREAVLYAREKGLKLHVLGGGSNTIFSDDGFEGLVVKVDLHGVEWCEDGRVVVKAGEDWDNFVARCVEKNFAGVECMSGIPGSVGATPIQNVAAYGQQVSDVIREVTTLDVSTLEEKVFQNSECNFDYRSSRFKYEDAGKYIVTEVVFQLEPGGEACVAYEQVREALKPTPDPSLVREGRRRTKLNQEVGFLPYYRNLVEQARRMRANPTQSESVMWKDILKSESLRSYKFLRQKPLEHFIADFYCSELLVVIEVDGDGHDQKYDDARTDALSDYGIEVIRYSNRDVLENTSWIRKDLSGRLRQRLKWFASPPDKGDLGGFSLMDVRNVVLNLRKKKSMVIDASDKNTQSCGSFFENMLAQNIPDPAGVPTFDENGRTRVPTAWLIEQAGFSKGYRHNGIGISENHNLALVNYGGTTEELLEFAEEIKVAVKKKFGVELKREPVVAD